MLRSRTVVTRRPASYRLKVEQLEPRELLSAPSTPLNDIGSGFYNGMQGGLYPNGVDVRPAALETAADSLAAQIQPLNATGRIDPVAGKIVLMSIGMSNTSAEWDGAANAFEPLANADPSKKSQLVIINGAQSGQDATSWADINSTAWSIALSRLAASGLTANQVQVIWLKEAIGFPEQYGGFLPAAQKLQTDLEAIARNLKTKFPNVKIAYLSSRTHAFTTTGLNPEPYAFESGFSVKWTIQDQINGTGNLNWDSTKGTVVAPLLSWGPYLWANGTTARSDGFTWTTADVASDLTHPSASGVAKIGQMLLAFFKTDPTATPWFLRAATTGAAPSVNVSADHLSGSSGLTVHFTASATPSFGNTIAQYAWTFDDGDFAFGASPTKLFYASGIYQVHLAVTDTAGNVTLKTIAITIGGGSPLPMSLKRVTQATVAAISPAVALDAASPLSTPTNSNGTFQMTPIPKKESASWTSVKDWLRIPTANLPPLATSLSGASEPTEAVAAREMIFGEGIWGSDAIRF